MTHRAIHSHASAFRVRLRAQIEGKTYLQAAKAVGINPKTFPRHMKRAARLLAAAPFILRVATDKNPRSFPFTRT